jgi:hypothetical protein
MLAVSERERRGFEVWLEQPPSLLTVPWEHANRRRGLAILNDEYEFVPGIDGCTQYMVIQMGRSLMGTRRKDPRDKVL